jgi:Ca2+-binding RTX toxin-like protein
VDCDDDPNASGLSSTYTSASRADSVGNVCTHSSGVITCDLERGSGTSTGKGYVSLSFFQTGEAYDILLYGNGDNGEAYCTMINDPSNVVDEVIVLGSDNADLLSAAGSNPYGATFDVTLSGLAGDDIVVGSNTDDSDYSETLKGGADDDYVLANGGNDLLRGGSGDDVLAGGGGDDVLIAGSGSDDLFGNEGSDKLCTEDPSDLLEDDASDFSINYLYISSTGSGAANTSSDVGYWGFCGHTSYGSTWAGTTCAYTLTTAPAECSAEGVAD